MWNLKNTITSDYNKKAADTENKIVVTSEERSGRGNRGGGLGGTNYYVYNKLRGHTVPRRERNRCFMITTNGTPPLKL